MTTSVRNSKKKTRHNGDGEVKESERLTKNGEESSPTGFNMLDKRDRIVEVTSQLIVEKGIRGVPVSLIARASDVAVGTLYIYFKRKQDLVYAVYQKLVSDITEALFAGYSPAGSVQDRFFSYYSALFDYLLNNPRQARLLLYLSTTPYVEEIFREKISDKLIRTQIDILTEGREKRQLKDEHPFVDLWFIYGSLLFLVNKERIRKRLASNPKNKQRILQMWWDGIQQRTSS